MVPLGKVKHGTTVILKVLHVIEVSSQKLNLLKDSLKNTTLIKKPKKYKSYDQ